MKDKKIIFVVIGVLILLLVGGYFLFSKKGTSQETENTENVLPQAMNYEKIPEKLNIEILSAKNGKAVNFKIMDIPAKYKTIEYEFSYQTASGGLQGGNSSEAKIVNREYEKEILLGTCSAGGACTYDEGVEKIKFTIYLSDGTEKRYFEKEFPIE